MHTGQWRIESISRTRYSSNRTLHRPGGEMMPSMSYILLLVLLAIGIGDASVCLSDEETFHFTISSKKNSSHHRTIQVDLKSGKVRNSNDSGEITLDVEHGRSCYNNGELVRLSTSASVLETPLRRGDYELFPGLGYYKLHTIAEGWETARQICLSEGAHLIVINSDAEANVVREYFSRKPTFTGSTNSYVIFAGFHDKYTEGDYVTVTGVPLSKSGYTKWESGQPTGNTNQNYGAVHKNGLLFDLDNNEKIPFVCEQEL